jgi:hypothetical protein
MGLGVLIGDANRKGFVCKTKFVEVHGETDQMFQLIQSLSRLNLVFDNQHQFSS